jgi:hypothetical protein
VPDLSFHVDGAAAVQFAASPLLGLVLRIENEPREEVIHTVVLRCQVQIEATRRRYRADEQAQLTDLFGEPDRWDRTLRTLLWTHVSSIVPRFTGTTTVELPVPCTFDFNVAATKYFAALGDGDIPLGLLFSGTVFYQDTRGLQVVPIPWDREAHFKLPVAAWRGVIDAYYPNSAWLYLRRDVFDRLHSRKMHRGTPTWEQLFEDLLAEASEGVHS